MKIIVVGGVAGGATAAARLRRLDEKAQITVYERGEYISFANCGLPYHIGDVIQDRDRLLLETPETFKEKNNVTVKVKSNIVKINREKKTVLVKDLITSREYEDSYDYLVLSPGAEPIKPSISGIDSPNIFTLRNINDMDRIIKYSDEHKVKKVAVIGAGFIGLEAAENFLHKGKNVTIIEMGAQVLSPIDFEMASLLHSHITDKGVELILKDGVEKFSYNGELTKIHLKSSRTVDAQIVIFAIGVSPEVTLAKISGLELGKAGIKVNKYMQTSDPSIYAVGDAVEIEHFISHKQVFIPLAGPANRQARLAADNIINGNSQEYNGTLGTSIVKVFDMTAASTGLNERVLKSLDIKFMNCIISGNSNADYYPGATPLKLKLIFTPQGEILGAQSVGSKGVDKRIDVIATAIKGGLKVWDLKNLELAYAPPYGSAKDPVNIAGYVADNMLKNDFQTINYDEVQSELKDSVILDVRTEEEFSIDRIEGAVNIPLDKLREKISSLDKTKRYIIYCRVGRRGYFAYRILKQNGFEHIKNLNGGFEIYEHAYSQQKVQSVAQNEKLEFIVDEKDIFKIDACGMQCPGPIMETYKKISSMDNGQVLEVSATDPGFAKDIKRWAEKTGNKVLELSSENNIIKAKIQKGVLKYDTVLPKSDADHKTIVVFSNDLDKVLASFIIANGALSMGKKVTMFFTFWGLNVLRKSNFKGSDKTFIEKMFGFMMPKGSEKLKLSKMNMMGLGTSMMKKVMQKKNVDSLELLMKKALENGLTIIACQMSMDIMGIKQQELIDGVQVAGVATYLAEAEDSNVNLFI